MIKILEKLKKEHILCEIYDDLNDSNKFYVGYILALDGDTLIFESVSEDGKHDGYYCKFIDNIIQIRYKTKYLVNLEKLISINDFTRKSLEFDKDNLIDRFLTYILSSKSMCRIELLNNDTCILVGYISLIDSETINIKLIDENGEQDGIGIAKVSDITCLSIETLDLQKLKVFEN